MSYHYYDAFFSIVWKQNGDVGTFLKTELSCFLRKKSKVNDNKCSFETNDTGVASVKGGYFDLLKRIVVVVERRMHGGDVGCIRLRKRAARLLQCIFNRPFLLSTPHKYRTRKNVR